MNSYFPPSESSKDHPTDTQYDENIGDGFKDFLCLSLTTWAMGKMIQIDFVQNPSCLDYIGGDYTTQLKGCYNKPLL